MNAPAIAIAIFFMLLGSFVAIVALWEIGARLIYIVWLCLGLYVFALGAVGIGLETGQLPRQDDQSRRSP